MSRIAAGWAVLILMAVAVAAGASPASARQDCAPVAFPAGKDKTTLSGLAPADDVVCYELAAKPGQKFSLKVLAGDNTIFSVVDLQDAVDRFVFTAARTSYEIDVGQLMRAGGPEKFRIAIERAASAAASGSAAAAASAPAVGGPAGGAGRPFRDCETCPEMVPLPAGSFMMGSSAREVKQLKYVQAALPRHAVTIGYPFAIGRFEITVGEFDAFVRETGVPVGGKCGIRTMESGPHAFKYSGTLVPGGDKSPAAPYMVLIADGSYAQPGLPVTARQPAVCVSRNEIAQYLAWLSLKSGKHYRLPSEAEWEYAYRAGTDTINFWGDDFRKTCDYANFADRKSGYQAAPAAACAEKIRPGWTAEVGSYKPNPWGLYDMAGNAQETVEDCLHENYEGAPADGAPWTKDGCVVFVARGGDYELTQFSMRASERLLFGYVPEASDGMWTAAEGSDERFNEMGFRVAVSLDGTSWDKDAR